MKCNSVLIIDDDEDMGEALLCLLGEEVKRVRLASSGKQGLEMARAEPPDVILLDWQMPEMGGQEVLAELAELAELAALRSVPVILMSANIAQIPKESLKGRACLSKPFDLDALLGLVARQLA